MAVVAFLLVGAHFLRGGEVGLVAVALGAAGAACLGRSSWIRWVLVGLLIAAAGVWVQTGVALVEARLHAGGPWLRLALILTSVTGFTLATGLILAGSRGRRLFPAQATTTRLQVTVFAAVAVILAALHQTVPRPLLLAERYLPGWGWLELFLVATYAAVVSALLLDPNRSIRTRIWVWGGFSVVFFTQLGLGILGLERMLMTGQLHLPIPALILAGPLYRGEGIFMLVLFLATVVLVGPAWCSYLCYIGAWDGAASTCRRVSTPLPAWVSRVRVAI
ncbi:MAG: 4Fe-4S binding protein, partial [Candidatus Latescibacterota bacterium]